MENLGIGKLYNFVRFSCYSPRAGKTRRDSSRDKNNMVGVVRGKKKECLLKGIFITPIQHSYRTVL